jgi:uncharacterized protein YegL
MNSPKLNPPMLDDQNPKCPMVILLDTSSSMLSVEANGKKRIDLLNEGLKHFQQVLLSDRLASKRFDVAVGTVQRRVTEG